jgi:hypothetical protein
VAIHAARPEGEDKRPILHKQRDRLARRVGITRVGSLCAVRHDDAGQTQNPAIGQAQRFAIDHVGHRGRAFGWHGRRWFGR